MGNFGNNKWGVFQHFLYGGPGSGNASSDLSWNERVNKFDVNKVADVLSDIGADYYFITIMQGTEHMIAPNAAFDSIAGTLPGEACAERDLIADLYDALSAKGIDLCLYFTGDGPFRNKKIGKKFGFFEPRKWVRIRKPFVRKWSSVLEEYSVRYGDKISAWWIDGCYKKNFGYKEKHLDFYYNAIKKGNPDAFVAMNNGFTPDFEKYYSKEDFVAGEFNEFGHYPKSKYIDGARAHILAPLGKHPDGKNNHWCQKGVRFSKEYMRDYIARMNELGGIVTIDVAYIEGEMFDSEQIEVLKHISP